MKKLYMRAHKTCNKFFDSDEFCYELSHFQTDIDDGVEVFLLEYQRDIGSGDMWCKANSEPMENTKEYCGKLNCSDYVPRNGKSGRCNHLDNCFAPTGKVFRLTEKGLELVEEEK